MTETIRSDALAAILDAITLMQEQLEEMGAWAGRIEAGQAEIAARLERLDAAYASAVELGPQLKGIRGDLRVNQAATRDGLVRLAEVAGWAHAAAIGNPAPLPVEIVDDPLLERFVLSQPADRTSTLRSLMDWRRVAVGVDTVRLTNILERQYKPSPTDRPKDRMLRYQLAAVTREELIRRNAALPALPSCTVTADRSDAAQRARSAELLAVWRAGEGAFLFSEPELAGALDIVAAARGEGALMPEQDFCAGLDDLHETISGWLAEGYRPALARYPDDLAYDLPTDRSR
ncbi:hypothetical protein [Sphingomonas sp. GM_Shp_2]|uniref:hypothetical protein n=1 Tax=Sphingomonas sp. GM_Shp_2 TaxID=2937380 RepID=UPI00226A990D|nr:hypothetical protein [Sphingomonas sp. GM_Shp_2]